MGTAVRHSAADVVRVKFSLVTPALDAVSAPLWQPDGLERRYRHYLQTMHGVLRASVPLMELAAELCLMAAPHDPLSGPLRTYLLRHAAEERGHDDWLLSDLAALGHDPYRLVGEVPPPVVARLVGPQYYWIRHHHPVALLGYIAMLEAHAPSSRLAAHIALATGAPEAALRTVHAHADLDPGHSDAVFELLDRLPLTAQQLHAVTVSGLATAAALMDVYAHVIHTASQGGQP
ncbi:MAG: hypothetical protein JWN00_3316 [Actinomycetia bacterium]|jgi:hypothetical protein|nr:hypothetical protein [Actinomycetes bacterium]